MPTFDGRVGKKRALQYNVSGFQSPADHSLPYENHYIVCEDGIVIHGWLITQPNKSKVPTLIFFHGNAGNIKIIQDQYI
jgi:hypothetical protein